MHSKNLVVYIFFLLYVSIFFFAVFMQNGKKSISAENIEGYVNLVPVRSTINDFSYLTQHGLIGNMNLFNNIIGNIILFMPLPFFLIRIFNYKKILPILLTALLLSLWVEAMQYIFILGVPDIDDVLLNVLGAFLGWILIAKIKSESIHSKNQ